MANWSDLKSAVASIIKTNGAQQITGQLLQNVLNNIISNVGLNSTFAGIATPETNPGTPDGNVFYFATTVGTYSNFNGIVIEAGEAVILDWKGSWQKKKLGFATEERLFDIGSATSYISGFKEYGYINPSNGIILNPGGNDINHNKFFNTGYLKINRNKRIVFRADTANKYNIALAYYDSDKNFISGLSNITTDKKEIVTIESANIPSAARYIAVSARVTSKDHFVAYTPYEETKQDFIIDTPKGKNLYNKFYSDYIVNNRIDSKTSYTLHGVKRDRTELYITISKSTDASWNCGIKFYDKDYEFLHAVQGNAGNTFSIPQNTEYIVFTTLGYNILYNHDFMINYGEDIIEYEAFNSSLAYFRGIDIVKDKLKENRSINAYGFGINGYIDTKGAVIVGDEGSSNEDAFRCTGLLKIAKGSEVWFKGDSANQYNHVIAFYDVNNNFISALSNIDEKNNEKIHCFKYDELPQGTRYIRVCRKKTDLDAFVAYTHPDVIPFDFTIDRPIGNNLYNINNGYKEYADSTLYFMPTAVVRDKTQDKLILSQRKSGYHLMVYFYDCDFELISRYTTWLKGEVVDIPEYCEYICFRDYGDGIKRGETFVNYGEIVMPYEDYMSVLEPRKRFNKFFSAKATQLTTGSLSIDAPNVKYNQTIGFSVFKVESFSKITLSHGKRTYAAGMVDIDTENITTYNSVPNVVDTIPHNLNIKTFLEVLIAQKDEAMAKLYIRTSGGEFVKEIPFNGSRDSVMIESENCKLTECQLTFSCADFNKDIWTFGDSYFDYIPSILKSIGYNNALFDAFSGRGSYDAFQSLKKMIGKVGVPKMIYWAMGMNDADSETSINSAWNGVYYQLIALCTKYNVELVFGTIPNVPSRNHLFKNTQIERSGYRYVDNNRMVGANISTSWNTGLLSSDNVHPTTEGAEVLAKSLVISIPELKST